MNKQNIPMRTEHSKRGLISMIDYIDARTPTKKLRLIEIGSYAGDSTEIFCKRFKHVVAIDPWVSNVGGITNSVDMDLVEQKFKERMQCIQNHTTITDFSYNACLKMKKHSADIVYIDGAHDHISVKCDIWNYQDKIRPGGWIAGHDYCSKFPGVVKAVNELLGKPDKVFPDNSWVKRV